jgi:hypothetical protein
MGSVYLETTMSLSTFGCPLGHTMKRWRCRLSESSTGLLWVACADLHVVAHWHNTLHLLQIWHVQLHMDIYQGVKFIRMNRWIANLILYRARMALSLRVAYCWVSSIPSLSHSYPEVQRHPTPMHSLCTVRRMLQLRLGLGCGCAGVAVQRHAAVGCAFAEEDDFDSEVVPGHSVSIALYVNHQHKHTCIASRTGWAGSAKR